VSRLTITEAAKHILIKVKEVCIAVAGSTSRPLKIIVHGSLVVPPGYLDQLVVISHHSVA
jgi:hypothetical protein